jgi:hypothetical protein
MRVLIQYRNVNDSPSMHLSSLDCTSCPCCIVSTCYSIAISPNVNCMWFASHVDELRSSCTPILGHDVLMYTHDRCTVPGSCEPDDWWSPAEGLTIFWISCLCADSSSEMPGCPCIQYVCAIAICHAQHVQHVLHLSVSTPLRY